jgi:hypothetical protein
MLSDYQIAGTGQSDFAGRTPVVFPQPRAHFNKNGHGRTPTHADRTLCQRNSAYISIPTHQSSMDRLRHLMKRRGGDRIAPGIRKAGNGIVARADFSGRGWDA